MKRLTWLTLLCTLALAGVACAPTDEADDGAPYVAETEQALLVNWAASGSANDASPAYNARFGRTVSVSGNLLAVTRNPLSASSLGTTQLFRRGASAWVRELNVSTPIDRFPVAVVGTNWVFVGEPCGTWGTACKGRVLGYWWSGSAWRWMAQINYADQAWDFGRSLAWHEATNTLAVVNGNTVRTYYVSFNSFVPLATMQAPASFYSNTGFGASLAVSANNVAVSAPSGTRYVGGVAYRSPGYVYVYDRNGNVQAILTGVGSEKSDTAPGFGVDLSLSASGNRLAVGAEQEVGRQLSAYVFNRSSDGTWSLSSVVGPAAGTSGGSIDVAIDTYLAVTTRAPNSNTQGSLRIFELPRFGPSLSGSFSLSYGWAPVGTSGRRVVVGQPNFFGDVGSVLTYYGSDPVLQ